MNVGKIRQYVRTSYLSRGENYKPLVSYYKEAVKNPTLAIVIKNDEIDKITEEFRSHGSVGYFEQQQAKNGFKQMYDHEEVKTHRNFFWNKFEELYPKSGLLRAVLCRGNRVRPKHVKRKANDVLKQTIVTEYNKFVKKCFQPQNII